MQNKKGVALTTPLTMLRFIKLCLCFLVMNNCVQTTWVAVCGNSNGCCVGVNNIAFNNIVAAIPNFGNGTILQIGTAYCYGGGVVAKCKRT